MMRSQTNSQGAKRSPAARRGARALREHLSAELNHERRAVLVRLLRQPMLRPVGETAQLFQLARRHSVWLKAWFLKYPGWHLRVDSRCIRLRKTPALGMLSDGTRGAHDAHSRQRLTPRRYGLLCFALAELGRMGHQATLGHLANRIMMLMNHARVDTQAAPEESETGPRFTLQRRNEREDLVHAVRLLVGLGVLTRVDGDEQGYIADAARDVLYNIDSEAVSAMLNVRRGPSTVDADTLDEQIAAITIEPRVEGVQAQRERCRQHLYRRLLEQPVVYFDELPHEERDYLRGQRTTLCRVIEQATGLIAEVRREGIAMVDEGGKVTDMQVLDTGTDGHAALLVAGFCTTVLRRGDVVVNRSELESFMAQQVRAHRTHWRKDATLPGAEVALVQRALLRLESLRLVKTHGGQIEPRSAIARYAMSSINDDALAIQGSMLQDWEEVEA